MINFMWTSNPKTHFHSWSDKTT